MFLLEIANQSARCIAVAVVVVVVVVVGGVGVGVEVVGGAPPPPTNFVSQIARVVQTEEILAFERKPKGFVIS